MSEQSNNAPVAASNAIPTTENQNTIESVETEGANNANSVADLKDQVENGTTKEKAAAKKMLNKLKIKFNGKETEETLPFEIPDDEASRDYMTKQLQMSKLAQSKSQEYSQLEKEVQHFINELKKNPRKVLADPTIGLDVKELAAQIIEEEIANSKKSPEQIEKEKLMAELEQMKEERKKEQEEGKKREFERLQQQEFERYDILMTQALEKNGDLPKSPYVVKKMADYMLLALEKGMDVTPDDVVPLVKSEIMDDIKEMFAVMPEEVIEKIIGKDILGKIRKKRVASAKTAPQNPLNQLQDTGTTGKKEQEPKQKKTIKQLLGV